MTSDLAHVSSESQPAGLAPAPAPRPRVWPAVVLVGVFWAFSLACRWTDMVLFVRFLSELISCALLILLFTVWWLLSRRFSLVDRLLGLAAAVAGGVGAVRLADPTLPVITLLLVAVPWVFTAWTAWLLLARGAAAPVRRLGLVAVLLLAWVPFTLIRMNGLDGDLHYGLHWRWSRTPEELYLAGRAATNGTAGDGGAPVTPAGVLALQPGDWPGFRGPDRDGAVHGVRIATDWDSAPPRQVWRQRVGPAWSSVAVVGDRLFTQEQRGDSEAVVCLDAATGREVWAHQDASRFWDAQSDTGPRATPTFADGRVYALGGRGLLNCLDAATGERKWSRDITADAGAKVPIWGFSSSPLVVQGVVVVFAGGEGDKGLVAYHADSGEPAWTARAGGMSYSSPQLATLGGQPQVLFLSDRGLTAVDPASGAVLWEHAGAAPGAAPAIQPHVIGDAQVLLPAETAMGLDLIDLTSGEQSGGPARRWTSKDLKPSYNDFVVHDGFLYGFDGSLFCCLDVQTGKRRWKEGRYGHGQVLLLADQPLLLVVSESGEAVLLAANPDRHEELGRFQAVDGKTWNHPVIAHGRLYVRNAEEMACYELRQPPAQE
jgi:outer membrane protein assembly factor BamB